MATNGAAPAKEPPAFTLTTSLQFSGWLAETGASLAVTTYQSGKVLLIGSNAQTGRISVFERSLERPMGLASTASAWRSRRSCR